MIPREIIIGLSILFWLYEALGLLRLVGSAIEKMKDESLHLTIVIVVGVILVIATIADYFVTVGIVRMVGT